MVDDLALLLEDWIRILHLEGNGCHLRICALVIIRKTINFTFFVAVICFIFFILRIVTKISIESTYVLKMYRKFGVHFHGISMYVICRVIFEDISFRSIT